jgi:DNA invertase Pin-like site-specific DNA recombinase
MSVELTAAWWGIENTVQGVDVLAHLKDLQSKGVPSICIDDNFFVDPHHGSAKTLFVTYIIDGQVKKIELRDIDLLKFADLQ